MADGPYPLHPCNPGAPQPSTLGIAKLPSVPYLPTQTAWNFLHTGRSLNMIWFI